MRIRPGKRERIVAHLFELEELQIAAGLVPNRPSVTLATCAGALSAEDFMRQDAAVAIGPLDFECGRPMRRLDT